MRQNTNNFTINYMLKWYLVMPCLLFKPSNVILEKQNYVGPIILNCTYAHLRLNLILLLNFGS